MDLENICRLHFLRVFTLLFLIGFVSCHRPDKGNELNTQSTGNKWFIRTEKEMFACKNKADVIIWMNHYPELSEKFLGRKEYPNDSVLADQVLQLVKNPGFDTVYQISQQVFAHTGDIEKQLSDAFEQIKIHYPGFHPPKVYTTLTGMAKDLMISDSIFVISLDFFLAEQCKYKPQVPVYIQKRYRKEYIVPMLLLGYSNKYNATDMLDRSMVAEMVAFGKSYYFLNKVLPDLPDSLIAGYSKESLDQVQQNTDVIWRHLVDKKLLFETNPGIVARYVGERPNVSEIGSKCPGRVGRWLGWQIVKKYMEEHPEVSLVQLMKEKDARKIFIESKYKPKPIG